jgi:hypothetical protein
MLVGSDNLRPAKRAAPLLRAGIRAAVDLMAVGAGESGDANREPSGLPGTRCPSDPALAPSSAHENPWDGPTLEPRA